VLTPTELPHYVYDDYVLWEGKWELIEGIPYAMMPSPSFRHQRISQEIARLLSDGLDGCEYCNAVLPVDWKVTEDTVVQPDNMVICYQPAGDFLTKAPSLIFEILSPATAEKDRKTKYSIYEREGVDYYCIVDPVNGVAKVFGLRDGRYVKQMDATDESFEFDLGKCKLDFEFARIWPA
jgi:Uma2 family endonuclease